jgi:sulfite exporter TauE/SafE/copper chaperone CopZ
MINKNKISETKYYVKGMHCASCEILIEKRLLDMENVESVEASTGKGEVVIEHKGEKPSLKKLNNIFKTHGYTFSDQPLKNETVKTNITSIIVVSGLIIVAFLGLQKLGLSSAVQVNTSSTLPMFFVFGLIAGLSSCAALVGGLILSLSKQWGEMYAGKNSFIDKLEPHLLFNTGRIIGYAILGAILGAIGSKLQISTTFTSTLIILISGLMIILGLQMLGVEAVRRFQPVMPRFLTRYVAQESNFKGRFMPFLMGALTFLLPCGFTITTEGLALISGTAFGGALIMMAFALGTWLPLMAIGISSIKFSDNQKLASSFSKVAGILVLFFAFWNINSQLNVLGLTSLSDIKVNSAPVTQVSREGLAPLVDGKQVIKMNASASGYDPNYFKVETGVPVRWEITDAGTSGCTNAVISNSLFSGSIGLTHGQTAVKEFTASKPGKYKFSCWMGMVSGIIEVIPKNGAATTSVTSLTNSTIEPSTIPSGAQGCGCGGQND